MPVVNDSFFKTIVDNISVLLKVLDQNGKGKYFNKSWLDFTGRVLEQEIGNGWTAAVHPEDILDCLKKIETACNNPLGTRIEYRLKRADGVYRWILEDCKPVFSSGGELESYYCSCLDITEQKEARLNSVNIYFDETTGFPNRTYFNDYLKQEWGRAARTVRSLTLLMCSANHIRQNDHVQLKLLGSTISKQLNRPGDFLALFNGETFAVVLPETDAKGAAVVVDRIQTSIQAITIDGPKSAKKKPYVPVISSVSVVPSIDMSSAAQLVELAEQAMYQAKKKSG